MRRGDYGDLYVQVNTEVPVYLNKEQKDLLEKFRKIENEKSNPSIKKFFQKAKSFGIINNGVRSNFPAIFLIAVLVLVIPRFLRTNSNSSQFFKNIIIWSIIIVTVVIISYLIF